MCMGALGGCTGISLYANIVGEYTLMSGFLTVLIAIIFAFLFGAIGGAIYCFLTVSLRANQNITGLALTSFGFGMCKSLISDSLIYSSVGKYFKTLFPYEGLGVFGEIFLSYGPIFYLSIIIALSMALVIKKTKTGLHLRAVGENPATADAAGINVTAYKYIATVIGCGIAGLGGLFYMLEVRGGNAATTLVGNIESIGWLAVALVIFSVWRPNIAILCSFVFGICASLGSVIFVIPLQILQMLPYLVTIIVLIITSIFGSKSVQPPAALGLNYFREDR